MKTNTSVVIQNHIDLFGSVLVSEDTLNPVHLLEAFSDSIRTFGTGIDVMALNETLEHYGLTDTLNATEEDYVAEAVEEMNCILDSIADRHGLVFGASLDDGACFAMWPPEYYEC